MKSTHRAVRRAAIVMLLTPISITAGQENGDPPPTTQPAIAIELKTASDRIVAQLRVDPRGVSSMILSAESDVDWVIPRRDHAWDYREWQWWRGHPWGDQMRPRFQGNPRLQHNRANEGYVRIDYEVDGFHGVQQYLFSRIDDPDEIHWDLITTIRNASGVDVSEYGQFFACYTPLNRRQSSYFWNSLGQLELWSERRVGHLNGYVASPNSWVQQDDRIPHCPRGGGRIVGEWKHPVLVSHASPDGRRFVLMIEEARCTAVAQGMEGNAMDYILYPEHTQRAFANDASFSVHIRHHIIKSPEPPEPDRLERLWKAFEESYKEAHRRAAKLR